MCIFLSTNVTSNQLSELQKKNSTENLKHEKEIEYEVKKKRIEM